MKRSIANSIPLGTVDVIGYDARIKDYVLDKIGSVYESRMQRSLMDIMVKVKHYFSS